MKNGSILSYFAMLLIAICSCTHNAIAQDSTTVKDSLIVSPFKELPVTNIKAIGDKKTGQLIISMEFVNGWKDQVEATLFCSEWYDFGITTDKGIKYKVPTQTNPSDQGKYNAGYKSVIDIQYGSTKLGKVPVLMQYLKPGISIPLTIRISGYDKTSKMITEIHLNFKYYQFGGGYNAEGRFHIRQLAIDWK